MDSNIDRNIEYFNDGMSLTGKHELFKKVLGQLGSYLQNNNIGSLSHSLCQNK